MKPGSIAAFTQGWRGHMLATHRKQVALAEARKADSGVSPTLTRVGRCLSYKRGELEARVWRHPAGSGYVCLLKDWGKGTSQETVQPMVEAQRSARHFIGIRKGNE